MHISIAAEKIFAIGNLPITNSILTTWIVMFFLVVAAFFVGRRLTLIPGKLQLVAELAIGGLYSLFEPINGQRTKDFFPILASLFIFILAANWSGLIPGVGTIGFFHSEGEEKVLTPIFRSPSADLNTTFALALLVFFVVQYTGLRSLGPAHYLSKYINFQNPLNFFVGFLEIIQELSRPVSFAFRLFGNIFAGEVLLVVISTLLSIVVIAPLPFYGFELFVGVIQAAVFAMLTSIFLSLATAAEH